MHITLIATPAGDLVVMESEGIYRHLPTSVEDLPDLLSRGLPNPDDLEVVVPVGPPRTPLSPGKIVAIGLNYLDHCREVGMEPPKTPLVFAKFPSAVCADGDFIDVNPHLTERVDWEVELAVVIGRRARDVTTAHALDHVAGYLVANDLSARDLQFADGQWMRGKNLDGFCPLSSTLVTADEVPAPQALALGTEVNGEVRQLSNTAEMIFSVAEIISFCSRSFTLEPGDVLLTGTPWGCGEFMSPPQSLKDGDVVRVWVEGVGSVTNTFRHAPST